VTPSRLYGLPGECPVTRHGVRCSAPTPRSGAFMCAPHWRRVPRPARDAMFRTWRAWQADPTEESWDRFLTARAEALDLAA